MNASISAATQSILFSRFLLYSFLLPLESSSDTDMRCPRVACEYVCALLLVSNAPASYALPACLLILSRVRFCEKTFEKPAVADRFQKSICDSWFLCYRVGNLHFFMRRVSVQGTERRRKRSMRNGSTERAKRCVEHKESRRGTWGTEAQNPRNENAERRRGIRGRVRRT